MPHSTCLDRGLALDAVLGEGCSPRAAHCCPSASALKPFEGGRPAFLPTRPAPLLGDHEVGGARTGWKEGGRGAWGGRPVCSLSRIFQPQLPKQLLANSRGPGFLYLQLWTAFFPQGIGGGKAPALPPSRAPTALGTPTTLHPPHYTLRDVSNYLAAYM